MRPGQRVRCNRRFSNDFFRTALRNQYVQMNTAGGQQQYVTTNATRNHTSILLPSDKAMLESPLYKSHFVHFAHSQSAFYRVFARAYARLLELGMPTQPAHNLLPPTSCLELTGDERCLTGHTCWNNDDQPLSGLSCEPKRRLYNHSTAYVNIDLAECARRCADSTECGAVSWLSSTDNDQWRSFGTAYNAQQVCFFFKAGEYTIRDDDMFTSCY